MELQYAFALLFSAIISTIVAMIAWQRRSAVGGTSLFIIMLAASIWSLTYSIRWLVNDVKAQLFWLDATYFGVVVAPTAFLILAFEYTDRVHILTSRIRLGFSIIPILTIAFLWTDPWHGLFYNGLRTGDAILNGGIWFWIFIVYTYLVLLMASILIIQKIIRDKQFFQVQAGILLFGMLLPWMGNIISMFGFSPFPGLDLTPFLFMLSGIFFMFGLFRFGLLDIGPIARSLLMENLQEGVLVLDKENRIVDLNPAAKSIFNISDEVFGKTFQQAYFNFPILEQLSKVIDTDKSVIQVLSNPVREYAVRTFDLSNQQNKFIGKIITINDVTEYREVQEKIRQSEEKYRLLFDNSVESILVIQDRIIVFCNPVTTELTGYSQDELINQSFVKLVYPEDLQMVLDIYKRRVGGEPIKERYQFRLVRKDLSFRWVETSGILIDWEGQPATLHFLMDVTERKKAEVALEFRSTHDILTRLYNRQYFELEMERLQNSRRQPISILVMDMNGLKEINDTLGHAAGDEQLRIAAQVIRTAFRPDDVIARIGGDEFVVLLPETDRQAAETAVNRVISSMQEYNQKNPDENLVSFAIGYATNEENPDLREVFRVADRQMYVHKAKYYAENRSDQVV